MARPRTPTKVLEARGAFKKDPQRKREGEPVVKNPLGAPPDGLDEMEVAAWHEIARYVPLGVLTEADRFDVEMAARLLVDVRKDFDTFSITSLKHLHMVLGKFGMNPSDRARLNIEKPQSANLFDALS
jgi:phage terminase small subunit